MVRRTIIGLLAAVALLYAQFSQFPSGSTAGTASGGSPQYFSFTTQDPWILTADGTGTDNSVEGTGHGCDPDDEPLFTVYGAAPNAAHTYAAGVLTIEFASGSSGTLAVTCFGAGPAGATGPAGSGSGTVSDGAANDVTCYSDTNEVEPCQTGAFTHPAADTLKFNDVTMTFVGGVFTIQDATPTTGVSKLIVKAGAGQSGNNLFETQSVAGAPEVRIQYGGRIWTDADVRFASTAVIGPFTINSQGAIGAGFVTQTDRGFAGSYFLLTDGIVSSDVGIARDSAGVMRVTDGSSGAGSILASSGTFGSGTPAFLDLLTDDSLDGAAGSANFTKLQVDRTTRHLTSHFNGQASADQFFFGVTGSAAIDFGSINDGACAENTFTLTGASSASSISPKWPAALETGLFGSMIATATNTVTVRLCNLSGSPVDPASATFAAVGLF